MGKSNYALNAPESILAAARRAAKRDGVSLNQFINTALAEKVAAGDDEILKAVARVQESLAAADVDEDDAPVVPEPQDA